MERIETVIVGGGSAGLSTSYHLTRLGREHVVLEQGARPGTAWREDRWDSFTLVTPNWAFRLAGAEYAGPDRDGYMPLGEIVSTIDWHVERHRLPVRCNTRVTAVTPEDGDGYRVQTTQGVIAAKNVVFATGFFQHGKVPPSAADLAPGITQLHSGTYRNPASLPAGAVLVVGSGQSGAQIAEELYRSGRTVFLATGGAGRAPRRYRGKDIIAWIDQTGFIDLTPDQLPPGMGKFDGIPHLSGANGGHTLNLHQFARDGVTLLGHFRAASGDKVRFAPDLHENLAKADAFERDVTGMLDGFIQANGLDAPPEELPTLRDGFAQPAIEELDLTAAGITTIIWAIGYAFDYTLVRLPVFDADGFPIQDRGITRYPGLAFVGMPWMPGERSGFLLGVGDAAAHVVATITGADADRRRVATVTTGISDAATPAT